MKIIGLLTAVILSSALWLAACTHSDRPAPDQGSVPTSATLNYYSFPDPSGATAKAAASCNSQSHGKYKISYKRLPPAADAQRQQLARLLAAHDNTVAIMGLDVTW
jgi:ABC-type glycerol-3-phosphate transport system substrate-binding protein